MGNEPIEFKTEDQGPIHPVQIGYKYALGKTEVTRQQFQSFVDATGYRTDAEKLGFASVPNGTYWNSQSGISWRNPGFPQTGKDPVICLSWFDAQEFCVWLSRQSGRTIRLPSEAEWEYACWAGELNAPSLEQIQAFGWFRYNSDGHTHPVGQRQPNPWGLYDMLGNAWEWCLDGWEGSYEGAPADGRPWSVEGGKIGISRGGSFVNSATHLHPSARMPMRGDTLQLNNGFRLVLEIEPPPWRTADAHEIMKFQVP
jgi:formylglycine-generating enzyme required for sulfatase activity